MSETGEAKDGTSRRRAIAATDLMTLTTRRLLKEVAA